MSKNTNFNNLQKIAKQQMKDSGLVTGMKNAGHDLIQRMTNAIQSRTRTSNIDTMGLAHKEDVVENDRKNNEVVEQQNKAATDLRKSFEEYAKMSQKQADDYKIEEQNRYDQYKKDQENKEYQAKLDEENRARFAQEELSNSLKSDQFATGYNIADGSTPEVLVEIKPSNDNSGYETLSQAKNTQEKSEINTENAQPMDFNTGMAENNKIQGTKENNFNEIKNWEIQDDFGKNYFKQQANNFAQQQAQKISSEMVQDETFSAMQKGMSTMKSTAIPIAELAIAQAMELISQDIIQEEMQKAKEISQNPNRLSSGEWANAAVTNEGLGEMTKHFNHCVFSEGKLQLTNEFVTDASGNMMLTAYQLDADGKVKMDGKNPVKIDTVITEEQFLNEMRKEYDRPDMSLEDMYNEISQNGFSEKALENQTILNVATNGTTSIDSLLGSHWVDKETGACVYEASYNFNTNNMEALVKNLSTTGLTIDDIENKFIRDNCGSDKIITSITGAQGANFNIKNLDSLHKQAADNLASNIANKEMLDKNSMIIASATGVSKYSMNDNALNNISSASSLKEHAMKKISQSLKGGAGGHASEFAGSESAFSGKIKKTIFAVGGFKTLRPDVLSQATLKKAMKKLDGVKLPNGTVLSKNRAEAYKQIMENLDFLKKHHPNALRGREWQLLNSVNQSKEKWSIFRKLYDKKMSFLTELGQLKQNLLSAMKGIRDLHPVAVTFDFFGNKHRQMSESVHKLINKPINSLGAKMEQKALAVRKLNKARPNRLNKIQRITGLKLKKADIKLGRKAGFQRLKALGNGIKNFLGKGVFGRIIQGASALVDKVMSSIPYLNVIVAVVKAIVAVLVILFACFCTGGLTYKTATSSVNAFEIATDGSTLVRSATATDAENLSVAEDVLINMDVLFTRNMDAFAQRGLEKLIQGETVDDEGNLIEKDKEYYMLKGTTFNGITYKGGYLTMYGRDESQSTNRITHIYNSIHEDSIDDKTNYYYQYYPLNLKAYNPSGSNGSIANETEYFKEQTNRIGAYVYNKDPYAEKSIYYVSIDGTIQYNLTKCAYTSQGSYIMKHDVKRKDTDEKDDGDGTIYMEVDANLGSQNMSYFENNKEIIAMATTILQNDFSKDSTDDSQSSTSNATDFAIYSYNLWLNSHYCAVEEDVEVEEQQDSFWDKIANWFAGTGTDGEDKYQLVVDNYKSAVDNNQIYLTSLGFASDTDNGDARNLIVPLDKNAQTVDIAHYISTPLSLISYNLTGSVTHASDSADVTARTGLGSSELYGFELSDQLIIQQARDNKQTPDYTNTTSIDSSVGSGAVNAVNPHLIIQEQKIMSNPVATSGYDSSTSHNYIENGTKYKIDDSHIVSCEGYKNYDLSTIENSGVNENGFIAGELYGSYDAALANTAEDSTTHSGQSFENFEDAQKALKELVLGIYQDLAGTFGLTVPDELSEDDSYSVNYSPSKIYATSCGNPGDLELTNMSDLMASITEENEEVIQADQSESKFFKYTIKKASVPTKYGIKKFNTYTKVTNTDPNADAFLGLFDCTTSDLSTTTSTITGTTTIPGFASIQYRPETALPTSLTFSTSNSTALSSASDNIILEGTVSGSVITAQSYNNGAQYYSFTKNGTTYYVQYKTTADGYTDISATVPKDEFNGANDLTTKISLNKLEPNNSTCVTKTESSSWVPAKVACTYPGANNIQLTVFKYVAQCSSCSGCITYDSVKPTNCTQCTATSEVMNQVGAYVYYDKITDVDDNISSDQPKYIQEYSINKFQDRKDPTAHYVIAGNQIGDPSIVTAKIRCGGHTSLCIEPVILTFNGSITMFDVDGVADGGNEVIANASCTNGSLLKQAIGRRKISRKWELVNAMDTFKPSEVTYASFMTKTQIQEMIENSENIIVNIHVFNAEGTFIDTIVHKIPKDKDNPRKAVDVTYQSILEKLAAEGHMTEGQPVTIYKKYNQNTKEFSEEFGIMNGNIKTKTPLMFYASTNTTQPPVDDGDNSLANADFNQTETSLVTGLWSYETSDGEEYRLNCVDIVENNWMETYNIDWSKIAQISNDRAKEYGYVNEDNTNKLDSKFPRYVTVSQLEHTEYDVPTIQVESTVADDKTTINKGMDDYIGHVVVETINQYVTGQEWMYQEATADADGNLIKGYYYLKGKEGVKYDLDALLYDQDGAKDTTVETTETLADIKWKGATDTIKDKNRSIVIDRVDRIKRALPCVGRIAYSRSARYFFCSTGNPIGMNWKESDTGLRYKTDDTGFAMYIIGNEPRYATSLEMQKMTPETIYVEHQDSIPSSGKVITVIGEIEEEEDETTKDPSTDLQNPVESEQEKEEDGPKNYEAEYEEKLKREPVNITGTLYKFTDASDKLKPGDIVYDKLTTEGNKDPVNDFKVYVYMYSIKDGDETTYMMIGCHSIDGYGKLGPGGVDIKPVLASDLNDAIFLSIEEDAVNDADYKDTSYWLVAEDVNWSHWTVGINTGNKNFQVGEGVDGALALAKEIADDQRFHYVCDRTGAGNGPYGSCDGTLHMVGPCVPEAEFSFECIYYVQCVYKAAGVIDYNVAAYVCNTVYPQLIASGFTDVTSTVDLQTGEGMMPGDILLCDGHAEMYYGNGQLIGAHNHSSRTCDDSISVRGYYASGCGDCPWMYCLRYTGN